MKYAILCLGLAVATLQISAPIARAEMSDAEKGAAALAILGIAALAHNRHHYNSGYAPADGHQTAEFERGYRDALHGHSYDERHGTRNYAEGYQAGLAERESATTYRRPASVGDTAPPMAIQGCARIVAQNFAVSSHHVHMVHARSPETHRWLIEAKVGHQHMVCTMRDSGEVIEVRGGRL